MGEWSGESMVKRITVQLVECISKLTLRRIDKTLEASGKRVMER